MLMIGKITPVHTYPCFVHEHKKRTFGTTPSMVSPTTLPLSHSFSSAISVPNSSQTFFTQTNFSTKTTICLNHSAKNTQILRRASFRISKPKLRATLDEKDEDTLVAEEVEKQPSEEVEESVKVLKNAAKTREVEAKDILSALSLLEKAKLDPSGFFEILGGSKSPGKTWMLIFTAEKQLKSGKYFPITAVQRFDAAGKRIENGVYLGPLGCLTFEGRLSWKKRILAFAFERIRIKIGPFNPFEINIKGKVETEPNTKNPFFIWYYVDEEIAVARGKSGGTAFWCRCRRIMSW